LAYAGLETGVKTEHLMLKQDKIRIVLTTPLTQDSPHEHLKNMVME
jgi:4-hydroxyphenylpyruvate dioxygenase